MATKNHNLSKFDSPLPSAADMRFGIVVAEWNREVTEALLEGAVRTLRAAGCPDMNIQVKYVPGTFELSLGAQFFAEYTDVDAVIALGCVIQGDTRHFDFICQGVTQGITQLQIQWNMPIAFGVLTVIRQAGPFALCRIGLITGRTHQIRAHLAYLGHPVLGDIKYGNHKMNERTGLKTQALCAQRLTFGRIPEENTLHYLSGRVIKLNDPEIVKTYERLTAEK